MADHKKMCCCIAAACVVILLLILLYKRNQKCSDCGSNPCNCPGCTGCQDKNDASKVSSLEPFVSTATSSFAGKSGLLTASSYSTGDPVRLNSVKSDQYGGTIQQPGENFAYGVMRAESHKSGGFHGPLGHSSTDLSVFEGVL